MQIVQTVTVPSILPTSFIFVFSYVDVIHHGVEVSGMDLVQVVHGWATGTSVESGFVPSFASECMEFKANYSMWAFHGLRHGIVQGYGLLLNRQLSHFVLTRVSTLTRAVTVVEY